MNRYIMTAVILLLLCRVNGQALPVSTFEGLQEIKGFYDPKHPQYKWYHLSMMTIKGDSVFLDLNPVCIYKKDTLHSASDGGYYYYHGTITRQTDSIFSINLTEIFCDYCDEPKRRQPDGTYKREYRTIRYQCKWTKNGFRANNMLYKRTANEYELISENPSPYL